MYIIQYAKDENILLDLKRVYKIETVIDDDSDNYDDCEYELKITDYTDTITYITYVTKKALLLEFNAIAELTHDYS